MNKDFSAGDRVRVSTEYHWAKSATGTVRVPPVVVCDLAEGWKGSFREVESRRGTLIFYWIEFDQPQFDLEGDGPFKEAEIDSNYLSLSDDALEAR